MQPPPNQWQPPTPPPPPGQSYAPIYQQPGPPQYYASPPQQYPPPKPKLRLPRWLLILIILIVAGAVVDGVIQGISQAVNNGDFTAQSTPTPDFQATTQAVTTAIAQENVTPTIAPTPTSGLAVTHGTPILGGMLSDFVGKYGQPDVIATGDYDFQNHTISVLTTDNQVIGILGSPSGNDTWSSSQAKDDCLAYAPSDATYQRHISHGNNDEAYVYVSTQLASRFPASMFTDENGNATTPGTLTVEIDYNTGSTSQFLQCSIETGIPSQ